MARRPFFSGNYGSALGSYAPAAQHLAQAGRLKGAAMAGLGGDIAGAIEKYQLNKEKRAVLTREVEEALPHFLNDLTMSGDEDEDKKNMSRIEKFKGNNMNMSDLKGFAGELARMEKRRATELQADYMRARIADLDSARQQRQLEAQQLANLMKHLSEKPSPAAPPASAPATAPALPIPAPAGRRAPVIPSIAPPALQSSPASQDEIIKQYLLSDEAEMTAAAPPIGSGAGVTPSRANRGWTQEELDEYQRRVPGVPSPTMIPPLDLETQFDWSGGHSRISHTPDTPSALPALTGAEGEIIETFTDKETGEKVTGIVGEEVPPEELGISEFFEKPLGDKAPEAEKPEQEFPETLAPERERTIDAVLDEAPVRSSARPSIRREAGFVSQVPEVDGVRVPADVAGATPSLAPVPFPDTGLSEPRGAVRDTLRRILDEAPVRRRRYRGIQERPDPLSPANRPGNVLIDGIPVPADVAGATSSRAPVSFPDTGLPETEPLIQRVLRESFKEGEIGPRLMLSSNPPPPTITVPKRYGIPLGRADMSQRELDFMRKIEEMPPAMRMNMYRLMPNAKLVYTELRKKADGWSKTAIGKPRRLLDENGTDTGKYIVPLANGQIQIIERPAKPEFTSRKEADKAAGPDDTVIRVKGGYNIKSAAKKGVFTEIPKSGGFWLGPNKGLWTKDKGKFIKHTDAVVEPKKKFTIDKRPDGLHLFKITGMANLWGKNEGKDPITYRGVLVKPGQSAEFPPPMTRTRYAAFLKTQIDGLSRALEAANPQYAKIRSIAKASPNGERGGSYHYRANLEDHEIKIDQELEAQLKQIRDLRIELGKIEPEKPASLPTIP